jgi:hypothetical protein
LWKRNRELWTAAGKFQDLKQIRLEAIKNFRVFQLKSIRTWKYSVSLGSLPEACTLPTSHILHQLGDTNISEHESAQSKIPLDLYISS